MANISFTEKLLDGTKLEVGIRTYVDPTISVREVLEFAVESRFERTKSSDKRSNLHELQASTFQEFQEGHFLLLIDDRQVFELSERVPVGSECEAVFLRMTPLVGG